MKSLRLRLFGAPEVWLDDKALRFDTRKAVALLSYLAVTARPHRRDSLAALLWPESDQARARASLRRTLSVAGAAGPALQITRNDVSLDLTQVSSDVADFQDLSQKQDSPSLRAAAALAEGQFLAGFSLRDSPEFDDWSAATADTLRYQLATVLSQLTTVEATAGRLGEAIDSARRWVALDSLSEAAHRELMRLYVRTGQRPAALKQYRLCVRDLDRELGVAPLDETTALYDDIRANRLQQIEVVPAAHIEVSEPLPVEPAPAASPNLVGRDAVVEALTQAWRSASSGGAAVALVGVLGIGRTALATHTKDAVASAGGRTVSIRGHAAESALAYAAMVDLAGALVACEPALDDRLQSVGQSVETPGERVRIFELMRSAVSEALSGDVPGLLVVDDAQWLDPTSADLLGYLARRPPAGVLLLFTSLSENFDFESYGEALPVLHLNPLTPDDVRQLLDMQGHSSSDAHEIHRRTSGNPRLIVESVLATDSDETSPTTALIDLIGARLDASPATTRQLLGATAVLGTTSHPELIRQVSGRDELEVVDALEDCVTRGLLVEDAERLGYDFPYDALRDQVLQRTSLARLRLLNGRAADALIRMHSTNVTEVPAARVASHLATAGREDEAAQWYWSAAQRSRDLYAHQEALDDLRSALALGFDAVAAHTATGDALTRLADYGDALVAYEQAASATGTDDPQTLAVIEHKLAEVHERLGDWEIARAYLESAADLLTVDGAPPMRAQVMADLALVMQRQGDSGAEGVGRQAVELAELSGDHISLAQANNVLGVIAAQRGDVKAAEALLMTSRAEAVEADDVTLLVAVVNNLARLYAQDGKLDLALEEASEALELGVRQGDQHRVAALHDHLADLLHRDGRDDEAMPHLKSAAALFADVDDARGRPEVWKLVSW